MSGTTLIESHELADLHPVDFNKMTPDEEMFWRRKNDPTYMYYAHETLPHTQDIYGPGTAVTTGGSPKLAVNTNTELPSHHVVRNKGEAPPAVKRDRLRECGDSLRRFPPWCRALVKEGGQLMVGVILVLGTVGFVLLACFLMQGTPPSNE